MRAAVLFRSGDQYRGEVFSEGLRRHGYHVDQWSKSPGPSDVLVMWNRHRAFSPIAEIYEAAGGRVIIAENGYTAPVDGGKHYALALDHHNGCGRWFVGPEQRHPIPEQPWRERGDHVLVLPQRGIGSPGVAMPNPWPRSILHRLETITDRPLRFRPHPGVRKGQPDTLPQDLAGAHCVVTWGSAAAIRALQAGVPAFYELDKWIAGPAARRLDGQVEDCNMPDRRLAWTRMSWAQWKLEEIASGEAFEGLLNAPGGDLFCAE